jgi:hypothetical protein
MYRQTFQRWYSSCISICVRVSMGEHTKYFGKEVFLGQPVHMILDSRRVLRIIIKDKSEDPTMMKFHLKDDYTGTRRRSP